MGPGPGRQSGPSAVEGCENKKKQTTHHSVDMICILQIKHPACEGGQHVALDTELVRPSERGDGEENAGPQAPEAAGPLWGFSVVLFRRADVLRW